MHNETVSGGIKEVTKVSDTKQIYKGKAYYFCGNYFQRDGVRLHRAIWEDHHGKIEKGMAVHHIDFDRSNNDISNLVLLSRGSHAILHGKQNLKKGEWGGGKEVHQRSLKKAAEWHGSEEGAEWHKQHYENNKHKLHVKQDRPCVQCGTMVSTVRKRTNVFCSNACCSQHRRLSGIDDVERTCPDCGCVFTTNKYQKKRCANQCSVGKHNSAGKK